MEFKTTLWAILIFSMIIVAAGVILDERALKYSSSIRSDLDSDFDKTTALSEEAESQQGRITTQSSEASSDFETETYRGGYGIITSIFTPLRNVYGDNGMIQTASERYGIPNYVINTIIAMFVFAIIMGIVAIVFRLGRVSA